MALFVPHLIRHDGTLSLCYLPFSFIVILIFFFLTALFLSLTFCDLPYFLPCLWLSSSLLLFCPSTPNPSSCCRHRCLLLLYCLLVRDLLAFPASLDTVPPLNPDDPCSLKVLSVAALHATTDNEAASRIIKH